MRRARLALGMALALALALAAAGLHASEEKSEEKPPRNSDVSATSKPEAVGNKAAERLGLDLSSNEPLEITSKSFEMLDQEGTGGDRLRFRGDVKMKQGDLELSCERLDAFYPEGAGSGPPQSIIASGDVQVVKGELELRCTRFTYEDANCVTVCLSSESCKSGKWPAQPARFKRGKDWIEGRELEFNQCTGKLFARCGARLQVAPQEKPAVKPADEPATDKPAADKPGPSPMPAADTP